MIYNFDIVYDRKNSDSVKWNYFDPDVLPLWVADMDFISPEPVVRALVERASQGIFGYAVNPNSLVEAIVERMDRLYAWKVLPEEVVILPGVVNGANLALHAFSNPGDGILVQTPVYPPLISGPQTTGRKLQTNALLCQECGSYEIDFQSLEDSIDGTTSMFVLCNPHNPVGRVYRKDELEKLAEICLHHNLTISSDEIHCDLLFSGHPHTPIASLSPEISRKTVTVMAPSKTYNIAGLNCSFAIVQDKDMLHKFNKARQGLLGGVNLLGLVAADAAYRCGQEWLDQVLSYMESNRDFLYDYVRNELPGIIMEKPEGTYLAWLDCRGIDLPEAPQKFFLEMARVGLNDGAAFGPGGEGHVRLNFACPRSILVEALEQMKKALQNK
jgi:cysteine-S-conjugate beta-lyase